MSAQVTHLSHIFEIGDRAITGTLCNRMTSGEINCSPIRVDVTCKFCLRIMREQDIVNKVSPVSIIADLVAALHEALEFIDGQVDVVDGDYGMPEPNRAMQVAREIREALQRAGVE